MPTPTNAQQASLTQVRFVPMQEATESSSPRALVEDYLERTHLFSKSDDGGLREMASRAYEELFSHVGPPVLSEIEHALGEKGADLFEYRVPKLSPDGGCSLIGDLDPTPYNLAETLGGRTPQNAALLMTLKRLIEASLHEIGCDWLGIYLRVDDEHGDRLVKMAYHGIESRAEFPLTNEFAQKSNNSTVGLTGHGHVVNDITAHQEEGGAYYECDGKVQAETCLPIFSSNGERVIGIIDAEDAKKEFFTRERVAQLVALAIILSPILER